MFDNILGFLERMASGSGEAKFSADEKNIAITALLFRVIPVDGIIRTVEREQLRAIMTDELGIPDGHIEQLIKKAREEHAETAGLFPFTSIINRSCSDSEKAEVVREMHQIAMSDGEYHEMEQGLIERAADLLHVEWPSATG